MDDLQFLVHSPSGTATLFIQHADSSERTITNLSMELMEEKCPLLAAKFRYLDDHSGPTYTIQGMSATAVTCFLRFVHIGDYAVCEESAGSSVPPLLHLQVFHLAEMWVLPDLQQLVLQYLSNETDPVWGSGYHPAELCEGLRYLHVELSSHVDLRKVFANYCVTNFVNDGLGNCEIFRQTVYQCPPLFRDLCRANMEDGFSNSSAFEIIKLPVCKHPLHDRQTVDPATLIFNCEFHPRDESVIEEQPSLDDDDGDDGDDVSDDTVTVTEGPDSDDYDVMSGATSPRESEASNDSHGFSIISVEEFEWSMLELGSESEQSTDDESDTGYASNSALVEL